MDLIIFYDTETNGLPQWNLPSEDPSQPHVTQLVAELCDERSGNTIATMDVLIKPNGWTISDDLAQLTGITTERAIAEGIPLADALQQFTGMWRRTAMRVGHNESFDARMLRIEYFRVLPVDDPFHDQWKGGGGILHPGKEHQDHQFAADGKDARGRPQACEVPQSRRSIRALHRKKTRRGAQRGGRSGRNEGRLLRHQASACR
jgi:hypothetical protein